MREKIVSFFVNELLWILSWGWHQLIFGIIFTFFLLMFVSGMRFLRTLFLVVSSYTFAIGIYLFFVAWFCVDSTENNLLFSQISSVYTPLQASIALAFIYSILQGLFYFLVNYTLFKMRFIRFFIMTFLGNILAAFFSSFFIKLTL